MNLSTCCQRLSSYLVFFIALFCFSFTNLSKVNAQCPTIFVDNMDGIPGYPALNDLSVCGLPDTLTYYVSNTSGTTLLNSEFTLHIPPGLQYGGFANAFDPNYSIMEGDISDLGNPTFIFSNIGADSVQIINIAVMANCDIYDLPPTSEFKFDADFSFLYSPDQFTAPIACMASNTGNIDYSPFIKRPTITITNQTKPTVIIKNGSRVCNNITVTQTGISATVTGFNFTIDGLDLTNFGLNEISVGGMPLNYDYDTTSLLLEAFVDDSFLPNGYLGEDEEVVVKICYDAPLVCDTDQGIYNLTYGASFGCSPEEPPCTSPSTADGTLTYTPNFGANPVVSITQVMDPGICGDNAVFDAVITSANSDPVLGLWGDVKIGFQVCESDALEAADVKINGASLPAGSFYYDNFDFVVDATTFNFDPDGPGVGFEDTDMDGIYDEVPGGNTVTMRIEVAVKCQDPEQIAGCAAIDCEFSQATVEGKRHCGQTFQSTPSISPAPTFSYGSEYTTVNEVDISTTQNGSILGLDFETGTGPNDGNGYGSTNTVDLEFCYKYKAEGINPCSNPGDTPYYEVEISGPRVMVMDLELQAGSVMFDGGAVAPGAISSYFNADTSSIVFRIEAGNNDETMEQCYNLTLELDSCVCYPRTMLSTSMRVVETCSDCAGPDGNDCTLVRACDETLLASNRSCDCITCPMQTEIVEMRRVEFGDTDKDQTMAHDETTVDPLDLNRYLPCDSIYMHIEYEVRDPLAVSNVDEIVFRLYNYATGGSWSHRPTFELEPDMHNTQIQDFAYEKVGTGVETTIDFNGCNTDGKSLYSRNLNDGYLDALGFVPSNLINGVSTYNHPGDVFDNREYNFTIHDRGRQTEEGATHGLSGDCWEYLREELMGGLEMGDKFHLKIKIPLQKNPYRQLIPDVAATPASTVIFRADGYSYKYVAGKRGYTGGVCGDTRTIETHCPGPIDSETTYEITDCAATVSHAFTMEGTPDDWYINEWRSDIMEFDTLLVPIPSPMVYAGNPRIVINGDTIPISDPTFDSNTFCAFDAASNQNKCTSIAGQTGLMMFDVSELPNFGVGLAGTDCSFELCYDLERLCPGPVSAPEDFALYYDYSLTCDYTPGGQYCNATHYTYGIGYPQYSFLGNQLNYPVEGCPGDGTGSKNTMRFTERDYHLTEDTSYTLIFNDSSSALPALTSLITNSLIADAAGASEFNTYEICAGPGDIPHQNVMTTIFVEPTVDLLNVRDTLGNPITFTLTNSNAQGNTYLIEHGMDLDPNTCVIFEIETELKICPYPGAGTMVNVKTTSSCLDLEFASQLFGVGGSACISTGQAYEYVAGEAEIQAEWELNSGPVALCSTNEFVVVVKNTKIATVVDLEFNFNFPPGLDIIPNSFEYEYPEGSGTWVSISDPTPNGANAFGPVFSMTDNDMLADVEPNGLPGILDTSAVNSNRLRIRFDAKTICDEYTSNTPLYFETTAADPCESRISSGFSRNEGLVVDNAIPSESAQFLLVADPLKYTCGGPVPVSISGTNLSNTGGETYMSEACFKFPSSLTYTMGSFNFTAPSSWTPTYVNEIALPGGFTQVCFDLPDGIKPLEIFAFDVELTPDPMAMCEELLFGGDVKSLVEDQVCIGDDNTLGTADDTTCDVYVNNAINDQIVIQIAPPAEIADLNVTVACDNDPTVTTYNYTLDMEGVSTTDYNGDIIVDWYRDLNLNGVYDDGIDPLLVSETLTANIPSGETIELIGSVMMPEAFSCPVIIKTTLDIKCDCASDEFYMDKAPTPEFIEQFDGPVQLCPGDDFKIAICSGYDFEVTGNATLTETADSLFIMLAPGAGINTPIILEATTQQGQCAEETFQIEIYQLESFDLGPFEAMEMCNMECTTLDLAVPADWVGNMTVSWSPSDYLDDPTSFTPMICNPTADITYTVTITNPNSGCTTDAMFPVTVKEATPATITYDGYEDCFLPYDPAKLIVEPAGMANYEFYYVDSTGTNPDVLLQNGPSNEFTLPFAQGKFYAIMNDGMCDTPTDTLCLDIMTCIFDLALTKVLSPTQPLPITVGDVVTFDIKVYNQGTVVADSITVTDYIPGGFTLMDPSWDAVMGTNNAEYFHEGSLAVGDSLTIPIMVKVAPGVNANNITNTAEISEAFNENDEDYPDLDSVEDDDPNNDAGGDVNGDSDNQTDGNGTDDEDDSDPATIPIFDLALVKKLANPQGMYAEGDTIKFDITVVNQGNMDATNIVVTDSLPCGLIFESTQSVPAGWSNTGQVTMATLPDTLAPNQTATIRIYALFDAPAFQICMGSGFDPYTNYSWIEDATDGDGNPQEDVDSEMGSNDGGENGTEPNTSGDNDTSSDGTDGNQDDHDPAGLDVFDLALTKMIDTSYNPGPYAYGDTAKFIIHVFNQGNIDATNIEIIDYVPDGFNYIAGPLNSDWTDNMDDTYSAEILDTLSFADTASICLHVEIAASDSTDAYINYSEISSSRDAENDQPGIDNDSTADNDPDNDSGGEPGSDDDDNPDGGGPGVNEDEDDHDPAFLPIFDLALKKTLATAGPYAYGDTLTFDITVYNQGNVTSTNIEVTDYIKCAYIFDMGINPDWTGAGNNATTVVMDTLASGDSTIVSINLILQPCDTVDAFKNTAEISGSEDDMGNDTTDDDADSDADGDEENDGDMEDDATEGENDDEDDSDFATPEVFDLAQIKEIVTPGPYMWGDTLQYAITVVNQGNVPATNIEITDNLPIGLTYSTAINTGWTGADPVLMTTITDTLQTGDTSVVYLNLILLEAQGGAASFTNYSEISGSEDDMGNDTSDDDADSDPDDDDSDDEGGEAGGDSDNQFDGNGMDDEDDHDPAIVEIFDLALTKTTTETGPFRYGDTVTFDFNVYNQGTMPATNIEITEYTPCGYTFDASINTDWALVGGYPTTTIMDTVGLADSVIVSINLIVQPCDTIGGYRNTGEISGATDDEGNEQEDIDSDPDSDPNNDGVMTDNENGNGNGDEDDSDFEEIEIFDLAQIKELATAGPYAWGDTLEYVITLVNQGNVQASNIVIADHVPAGLTFEASLNPDWTGATPTVETIIEGPLSQGDTARVSIFMILTQTSGGADDFTNISEISGSEDPDGNDPTDNDADSDSNGDPDDDNGGEPNEDSDNQFDGNGEDDEDDHDPAIVEVFDLALAKTTSDTGPFAYGDTITFDFTVYNQGNIPSTNIEITENTPCGYELVSSMTWTPTSDTTATTIITDTLQGGDSAIVSVKFIIETCNEPVDDAWKNTGEISASEDDEGNDTTDDDIDSDADDDPSNDGDMEDNATDGTNGDEDDSDFELIEIVDLAQKKELVTAGPYAYGDTLTYAITVYNQGNVKSTNIEVIDHVPAGLDFIAGINPDWSGTAPTVTTTITDTLCLGDSSVVNIQLVLQQATGGADDFTNISEISGSEDDEGNDTTDDDIDSEADGDPTDDEGGEPNEDSDNQTDGDGTDDEDDHDPAIVEIFDLALAKTTSDTGPFAYGDTITFDFTVYNQGSIPSTNIEITENTPCGYELVPSMTWTPTSDTTATTIITDTLQGGDSAIVSVKFIIEPCYEAVDDAWKNTGEISGSEDNEGNDTTDDDIDSDADDDPSNDGDMEDNDTDGTNGDEDDSDFELIEIVDLAQKKELVTAGPYAYGDTLTYAITVYNQGNVKSTNIELTDHVPAGLDFVAGINPTWSGTAPTVTTTVTDTLCTGDSTVVNILLILQQAPGGADDFTNISEISGNEDDEGNDTTDDDIDSEADGDPTDDEGGEPNEDSDNQTDGDGTDDEDDHDPAIVEIFDLALAKTTSDTGPFAYGDTITFDFTVYNQGSIPSTNIEITENTPCGYELVPSMTWTPTSDTTATTIITDTLQGGDSAIVSVNFIIEPCYEAVDDAWKNTGEISGSEDDEGNDTTDDDIDSDADDDPSNDGDMEDNDTDGTNGDEDDSDFELIEIVDLAQKKELVTAGPYAYGDTLTYAITVYNQGNVKSTNIELIDHVPVGLDFIAGINPNWSGTAPTVTTTVTDTLCTGDSAVVNIQLILLQVAGGADDYTNISEISATEDDEGNDTSDDDIDSDPDGDPTDDEGGEPNEDSDDQTDGDGTDDEDDHDPAIVEVFDLALKKTTTAATPFRYGDTLTFDFTVYNQGNIASTNIEVMDYVPCGYAFVPGLNPDWMAVGTDAKTTITDTLQGGDSTIVSIHLILQECSEEGAWKNVGEISGSEDDEGNDTTDDDIDSNADDDPDNDGEMDDNMTDGTNADEDDSDYDDSFDEDDSDPEVVRIFDLAQIKDIVTPGPYAWGDTLQYAITVVNQGNTPATNITVTDNLPVGLTFIPALNPDWAGAAPTVTNTITDTLQMSDTSVVYINLILTQTAGGNDNYTNTSEITGSEDDEGNDTTDEDVDDDDDATDEEDDSFNDGDDDRDDEFVRVVDLALAKTTSDTGPFAYGDIITFDFTVYNQGNIPSTNIEITENMPCGYSLVPSTTWTSISANTATTIITDTLQGGDSAVVSVDFIIEPCYEAVDNAWKNTGEISSFEDDEGNDISDEDIDSDADDDPSNDGDMEDNDTNGTNGDEDDSDFELIEIFDLAQKKELVTPGPHAYGDTITYAITVYNQGNIKTTNIDLVDHVPAGLDFVPANNPNWTGSAPTVTTTITDTLCTGDSAVANIQFVILPNVGGLANYTNISEISGSEDNEGNDTTDDDIDSDADGDATNDNGGEADGDSDNQTDGNGTDDEDDHDPATVRIFDLAMKKTTTATGPFHYGDVVTFDFTVYNQGNVPAQNIEVTEYTPCGFEFDASLNSGWTGNAAGVAVTTITNLVQPGDSTIVSINLIVAPCYEEDGWKNTGEISGSEDDKGNDTSDEDIDSTTDNDPDNDGDMSDNDTDSAGGDEDDSDFERIEVFDLAQSKRLAPGQLSTITVGSPVTYEMTIFNQGNTTAYDIELTDYIPNGLLFDPVANTASATGNQHNWTLVGGNATYGMIDSLTAQADISITITFTVDPAGSGGPITNYSEISNAAGTPGGPNADDADSGPDADKSNDNGGTPFSSNDNNVNGNGTNDEDDHDPAVIVTVAHYARIVDPCNCIGNGLISDKVKIHSTKPNENWSLVVNTGMYASTSTPSNLSGIPLGTTATFVGIEAGFYVYELPLIHLDGVGYTSTFSNGKDLLSVANLCVCPATSVNPDGTPAPGDTNPSLVFHGSKTHGESTLDHCDGITFTNSMDEHKQYVDTAACRIAHTICPTDQWKQISFNFSEFDLAAGDTLCVFNGKDTLNNQIAKWSGAGVSQTGGWISSHCSPTVNPSGCLTFLFKTNGDNSKGTGWTAEITCDDRGVTLNATDQHAKLACDETYNVFTIQPASIAADCGTVVDSQIVRVFNAHGDLCMDTCLAATDSFDETFGLGTYIVEYKLKSDTVKQTRSVLTVQEAPLVCNDKVTIPLGSSCSIFLTPDDLLEGPCDTITDSVYYFITLKGIDKNGNEEILAMGGGKGGNYPAITKEMIDQCGGTFTAEIEKRYYDGLNLTFCNNGPQGISCNVEVEVIDQTVPFFNSISTAIDTFRLCGADLTPENLGIPTPTALDNCTEASVEFTSVNVLTDGGTCDTTRAQIIWTATDACGNTATANQTVVILRPEIADIVMAPNTVLSCGEDGTDAINDFDKAGIPSIKVGKVVNGVLIPTDTIALDTANYICGYILQKSDVQVAADCGIKVFRTWDILDWCDSANGPQPLATQFIELRDTLAPTFMDNTLPTRTIDLPHDACTLDITTLDNPAATDNCSAVSVRMDAVFRIENGARWPIAASEMTALDCDSFLVRWVAEDACHEQLVSDTITQLIIIEDNTAPSAACVDKINLSLGQNDAKLHYSDIDGGSYDACGIVKYEVSRDEENWDENVIFTCDDAHAAATVYLRVTDGKGNQSTCWMTVNVEDKIAPICSDLPDMTGTCDEGHLGDLGASTDTNENGLLDDEWVDLTDEQIALFNAQYGNPNCSDNITCGGLIIQQQYQLASKKCGVINIQRRFRAIDWDGKGRTSNWSTQNINIESEAAWSITLPSDWKGTCGEDIPNSDIFITNGNCDLLAHEVEEKVFTITEDACLKVVRTFTIINWCNYESGQPTVTITRDENEHGMVKHPRIITAAEFENAGKLEYIQILKLQDDTAPVITIGNVDNCIESEGCSETKRFAITANDCNTAATIDLAYNWIISANGTQLNAGEGSFFEYEVTPEVNYEVNWAVADKCGNTAKETVNYEFKDCKKPAPYCLNGTAVELMSTGMIQVWAKDFERGSSDNCTTQDRLTFRVWHASLGDAPTDLAGVQALPEVITFNCATLGQQIVNLYAIDEAGNWDFCTTYVIVQDNMNACENIETPEGMAVVSGTIRDWKDKTVEEVQVQVSNSSSITTQADGFFNFELAMNNPYTIQPEKKGQPLNGVTTFDLVLISKHILGIKEFDNPYQMIAADANGSGSITAFDMVQIRQLILSIRTAFANNESWRFVDAAYEFTTDQPEAEDFPEVVHIQDLQHDIEMDFVAVKIGDVNGSAQPNSLAQAEDRTTTNTFEITTEDKVLEAGETYSLAFSTELLASIQGYQFTLGYENLKLEKLNSGVSKVENFGLHKMDEGMITTSWNKSVGSMQLTDGSEQPSTILFNIKFTALKDGKLSEQLSLINRPTAIEAYDQNDNLMDIQLTFTTPLFEDKFELFQNQPNPFHDKTVIGFNLPGDSEVQLILRDETGRVLRTITQDGTAGYNTIQLEIGDLSNGFIYYQLSTKFGTKAKKMIQLK